MNIRRETVAVTGATGGAGVATANKTTTKVVSGRVIAVYLEYLDTPPAGTTDVTIEEAGTGGSTPKLPILTVTNGATDGWRYPDVVTVNNDHFPVFVSDHVKVTIAGANDGDGVNATLVWIEGGH